MLDGILSKSPYEITLTGSFYEMGMQYANILGERILAQWKILKDDLRIENVMQQNNFNAQIERLMPQIEAKYPSEILEMFEGMVNSDFAKNNNLTLNDFYFVDQAVLISMFHPDALPKKVDNCSYFALIEQGQIGVGRNFDWPKKTLRALNEFPLITHLDCTAPGYPNLVTLVGHTGSILAYSLYNENLSWAHNSANRAMKLDRVIRFDRKSIVGESLIKLFKTKDFNHFLRFLEQLPGDFACTLSIAGSEKRNLASVEMCPNNPQLPEDKSAFKNLIRQIGSQGVVNPEDEIKDKGYVHTNLVHMPWAEYLGYPPEPDTPSHARLRYDNLLELVTNAPRGSKLKQTLLEFLDSRLGAEKYPGATKLLPAEVVTFHQAAFLPGKSKLVVRFLKTEDNTSSSFTDWKKVKTCR